MPAGVVSAGRWVAPVLLQFVDGGTGSVGVAERVYQTLSFSNWLAWEAELRLIMPDNCGEAFRPLISSLRERSVDWVRARSFIGFTHGMWVKPESEICGTSIVAPAPRLPFLHPSLAGRKRGRKITRGGNRFL